jgi:hypothetical protein
MFKVIALILERVEGLVLNLPPRSTGAHHSFDRAGIEREVRNPGPTSYFPFLVRLFVEQVVDTNIYCALAQAEIVRPGKVMLDPLRIRYS